MAAACFNFLPYEDRLKDLCLDIYKSNIPRFFAEHEIKDYSEFLDQFGKGNYWIMTDEDGKPVGCGGIAHEDQGLYSLCYGIIKSSLHRQGLGKKLIQFRIQKILERHDVTKIRLDTMQINPGFFEKFGFVTKSHEPNFYAPGMDKVEMSLEIQSEVQKARLRATLGQD